MRGVISLLLALGVGLGGGYWLGTHYPLTQQESATTPPSSPEEREVLFWRNPMNPAITSPTFQQDEMGMDYLPVYADDNRQVQEEPPGTVRIDPVTVQNIGVRTARAERRSLARRIDALGQIAFDEERLARLHPKSTGWIEKMRIDETGRAVEKDTILLEIYSPDLVAAQREYLVALQSRESLSRGGSEAMQRSARSLLQSSRERLELLDVPAHQIRELERSRKVKKRLHIHSPFAGSVMHIGAREGQYISPKDELYLIADLGQIWVHVDIYEDDLPWLKVGDRAEMAVRAAPGRRFDGRVTFIQPTLQERSRTVQVRLEFDNPDRILKPGMFANVVLYTDEQEGVVVPSEAIIRSGHHEQLFVVRAPGKFEPRRVTLGISADGLTQILAGLEPGEEVVTSSQFLIDSESKLREATAKMMAAMKRPTPPVDHSEMAAELEMSDLSMEMMAEELEMSDLSMETMAEELEMSDLTMESIADPETEHSP